MDIFMYLLVLFVCAIIKQDLDGRMFQNIEELRVEIREDYRRILKNQKLHIDVHQLIETDFFLPHLCLIQGHPNHILNTNQ